MPGPTVQSLAGLRLAVGVGAWLPPNLTGRMFGLDPASNPQSVYMARLFGIRDVALGVGALSAAPEARRLWLQLGLLSHVADVRGAEPGRLGAAAAAGAGALARRDGSVSGPVAAMLGGVAVAAAASGLAVL